MLRTPSPAMAWASQTPIVRQLVEAGRQLDPRVKWIAIGAAAAVAGGIGLYYCFSSDDE